MLYVDRNGLVKVVDLGLAKTPDADAAEEAAFSRKPPAAAPSSDQTTLPSISIGTPGFSAPELAGNPAAVSPRSDIYSLGCTLYFLLTGRPAFEGRTAVEIFDKQTRPIVFPDERLKSVPASLSAVVLKMAARRPEDRHSDMGEVIRDLESILGVPSSRAVALGEEQRALLEQSATAWHESPSARLRARVTMALLAASVGLALICTSLGWWLGAAAILGLGIFTALADLAVAGFRLKSPLFQKACALVLESSVSEWLTGIAVAAVFVGLLLITKLFWIWVCSFWPLSASRWACAFWTFTSRPSAADRSSLRKKLSDPCAGKASTKIWCGTSCAPEAEPTGKSYTRRSSATRRCCKPATAGEGSTAAKARPRFAPWRDPLVRWIDSRLAVRREATVRAVLQQFEERGLQAQGVNLLTARRKAQRAARAMVMTAAEIRETIRPREGTIMVNRSIAEAMRQAAVKAESVLLEHERGVLDDRSAPRNRTKLLAKLASVAFGPKIRFLAGAVLLAGCIAWMHQNAMISAEHAKALVEAAKTGDLDAVQTHALSGVAHAREKAAMPTQILDLPVLPPAVLAALSSFGAGAGGLILIVSSFVGGARIAFFAIPAAAIPILAPRLGLPSLAGLDPSFVPSIIGAGLMALGFFFGRR